MKTTDNLYPFVWKGKTYYKEECDELFIRTYHEKESMRQDGGVYYESHTWIFPDGSLRHEDEN